MLQNLTGWHALIVLAIVVLIFGAAKLPALAKSIGQSMRILKQETSRSDDATTTGPGVTNDHDSVVTRSAPAAPAADSPLPRTS